MIKNSAFRSRSKHIELRHHFIGDLIEKREIEVKFCTAQEQLIDIFTLFLQSSLEPSESKMKITD